MQLTMQENFRIKPMNMGPFHFPLAPGISIVKHSDHIGLLAQHSSIWPDPAYISIDQSEWNIALCCIENYNINYNIFRI